jgi:hypothetical protein
MRGVTAALRGFGLAVAGLLIASGRVFAQGEGNGSQVNAVPTLGGVGIIALAGALSIGGAWLLSRNRDKQE